MYFDQVWFGETNCGKVPFHLWLPMKWAKFLARLASPTPTWFLILLWLDTPQGCKTWGPNWRRGRNCLYSYPFVSHCTSRFNCPAVITGQSVGGDTQGLDRLETSKFPLGRVLWGMNDRKILTPIWVSNLYFQWWSVFPAVWRLKSKYNSCSR